MRKKSYLFKRLIFLLFILYCIGPILNILAHRDSYQWDFRIYYYGAKAYSAGLNPYDTNNLSKMAPTPVKFWYTYTPITLLFFIPISKLDYNTAFHSFLFLKCALLIGLIFLWRNKFLNLDEEIDALFYPFCLLAFNSAVYIDIASGNISILEQSIIWLALYFFLRRRIPAFCFLIIFAALFKIAPILFLFLLWFSENKNKYIYFFGSVIIFSSILLTLYITDPFLFSGFIRNISMVIDERGLQFNHSTQALIKDACYFLRVKTNIVLPAIIQSALFFTLITTIIFISWRTFIILRSAKVKDKEKIAVFLFCLVYALVLPRFKTYSYVLLLAPTYFIIKKIGNAKIYLLLLFIFAIPSSKHIVLPGFNIIFKALWIYYPLILAYSVWGLYLYEIRASLGIKNKATYNLLD